MFPAAAIAFAQPMLLWALALLPVLWWLLRFTPPRPRALAFPPVRLLLGLESEEETPVTSPWWLTALRVALAGLVILALAAPVLRPEPPLAPAGGPAVILVDNGWASGEDWKARANVLAHEVERARAADRPVVLVPTDSYGPSAASLPEPAANTAERLAGLAPLPLPPDRLGALRHAESAVAGIIPAEVIWLSDGIDHGNAGEFMRRLGEFSEGSPSVYLPELARAPLVIDAPRHDAKGIEVTLHRAAPGARHAGILRASARNGRFLGEAEFALPAGEITTTLRIDMPLELRNEIARVEIAGARSAAAVRLLDDAWQRRRTGLATGESRDIAQPLLSPLYYAERALAPFTELNVAKGRNLALSVQSLLDAQVGMIVMTDVGHIADAPRQQLAAWVEQGGVLVRFAGPRLASGADDLVPVRLRAGGRTLGGTLSWSEPQMLGEFDPSGPFAGMAAAPEVTVRQQVLAEPDIELSERTWARLADGTPLVTAARRGRGLIVLFHVTANTSWSNLPLSGLFVDMLRRISELAPPSVSPAGAAGAAGGARGPAGPAAPQIADGEAAGDQPATLPPVRMIDGFGAFADPPATAQPISVAEIPALVASADHPPGLYGHGEALRALNLLPPAVALTAISGLPQGFALRSYSRAEPFPLKPWLLLAALVLLFADLCAILAMSGLRLARRTGVRAAVLALAILLPAGPTPVRAQQSAADEFALKATLQTRLAYVLTGNADIDRTSRLGMAGLSRALSERTALEPGEPMAVDVARDELAFFPLLYWAIDPDMPPPDAGVLARIDAYMKQGGTILFDTRDQAESAAAPGAASGPGAQALQRLLAGIDVPVLEPVPPDHVLTKAFYLLQDFPGRWEGGLLWVEATPEADPENPRPVRNSDGVSSILVTSNDLAAAWGTDEDGRSLFPVFPGDERQRELAYRTGINIVIYALTGNYKADQVHVPALLERLGQ
ncbi:MAG: DUF4159 domain-containing protein [Rhodobiaceae bacterium]|nr:DUF4159 domain-containing protein [Rhodobiaceae bacterium]